MPGITDEIAGNARQKRSELWAPSAPGGRFHRGQQIRRAVDPVVEFSTRPAKPIARGKYRILRDRSRQEAEAQRCAADEIRLPARHLVQQSVYCPDVHHVEIGLHDGGVEFLPRPDRLDRALGRYPPGANLPRLHETRQRVTQLGRAQCIRRRVVELEEIDDVRPPPSQARFG